MLEEEVGRWASKPREERLCKHCNDDIETLEHFLLYCNFFRPTRQVIEDYPTSEYNFFEHNNSCDILYKLHSKRRRQQHGS